MADLRQRKPNPTAKAPPPSREKSKRRDDAPDLEPNLYVILTLIAAVAVVAGSLFYYKIDNRESGPFASWLNTKYPALKRVLNQPRTGGKVLFGAAAAETTGELKLTEEELKAYDGTDPEKPIYLGINGTIFDVSASPAFYGPGGHYHHFVGKDATRAWVTECWDEPEQFTWRMEGVEVMFVPRWMDEALESIANGEEAEDMQLGAMPKDMLATMAKKSVEKFGTVTDKEKAKRRVEDKEEAEAKVQETLAHWVSFFSGNAKYTVAGSVIREDKPEPPKPCQKAMEKRPLKGGKLEGVMGGAMGSMMGGGGGGGAKAGGEGGKAKKGEMPAHIKEKIKEEKKEKKKAAKKAKKEADEDEDLVRDEL